MFIPPESPNLRAGDGYKSHFFVLRKTSIKIPLSLRGFGLGVDIGATNTKFVLLNGIKVVKRKKISTPKSRKGIINVLEENIKNLISGIPKSKIRGIGIGIPGPLSKKRDFIFNPPNLRALFNFSLTRVIQRDLKIKTKMENDVNCFTLAEALMGSGKGAEIVVGLTLGTGVGGGIVIKSKGKRQKAKVEIFRGAFGSAGEIGHMVIKFDGGKSYSLEDCCSEKFFKRKKVYSKETEEKAKKGNRKALKMFEEYGKYLGIGLANIINILDPEMIVLGGGISKANKLFIRAAEKEIQKLVLSPLSKKFVKIKMAKLRDFAGAVGAALIIKNEREK